MGSIHYRSQAITQTHAGFSFWRRFEDLSSKIGIRMNGF